MDMFSFSTGMQPQPGQLQAFWASVAASDSQAPRKAECSATPALPAMSVDFIMYDYKTVHCPRKDGHDWSLCPCAHPNEKTRRRSPSTYNYASVICPEMKELNFCPRGDSCNMSHSVYEFWLHPSRYHTELCRMGARCNRKICFFAHNQAELRVPQELPVGAQIIPAVQIIPTNTQAISAGPAPPASTAAPAAAPAAVGAPMIPSIQAISAGPATPPSTAVPAVATPSTQTAVLSECAAVYETATAPAAAQEQPSTTAQSDASTPVVLQAPVLKAVSTAGTGAGLQDSLSSNTSEGTPCAASGSGPSSHAPSAADGTGSTNTSTPTARAQPKPQVSQTSTYVPDFGPANRQQRRQFVHRQPVYSAAPPAAASVLAPAALQGLLNNIGSPAVNLNQGVSLSALAQLRSQMAGLGVSAATAALYAAPVVSSGPQMAHGWHNGMGISQGFTYSQPTGGLLQVHQQQPMPQPSFGSQPSLFGSNTGMPGGGMLLQQQGGMQGGMPGVLGLGGSFADGGLSMPPTGQFPPGIVYQQAPAGAGGFGAVGSSLQPMSMQQVMLMPAQLGAHSGGSQALSVPMPAGSAAMPLQGSLFGFP